MNWLYDRRMASGIAAVPGKAAAANQPEQKRFDHVPVVQFEEIIRVVAVALVFDRQGGELSQ
jgi:hypothetical protein